MKPQFRTLAFSCDQYIPSGPEYINATVRELSCAVPGSELDMNSVIQGLAHIENVYGYSQVHLWR